MTKINHSPKLSPVENQHILDLSQKEDEFTASVQGLIAKGHAEDEQRVRSGELHPDSMFFIPREQVKKMTIVWNNDPILFDKL